MERFWSKVDTGDEDECWEWQGYTHKLGYGEFSYEGDNIGAHRAAAILELDDDVSGKHVLHHCDNRSCVNPNHLYVGTHKDNMQDRKERCEDIYATGEDHPHSKLTTDEVATLKWKIDHSDRTYQDLADEFGVNETTVGDIARGKTWGEVEKRQPR